MHFMHTVCNHFIIYIKFNMSMDEVNEVSQTSSFSIFLLWIKQLSDKVANVISCKFMNLYIGNFVGICFWLVFIDTCFLFKECLNKQWTLKCQRKKINL